MIALTLALLVDWLFPIDWTGQLTTDPADLPDQHARWLAHAHLEDNRATSVRPCPAVDRLFTLMDSGNKVTPDAWHPTQFNRWWQP